MHDFIVQGLPGSREVGLRQRLRSETFHPQTGGSERIGNGFTPVRCVRVRIDDEKRLGRHRIFGRSPSIETTEALNE